VTKTRIVNSFPNQAKQTNLGKVCPSSLSHSSCTGLNRQALRTTRQPIESNKNIWFHLLHSWLRFCWNAFDWEDGTLHWTRRVGE